MPITTNGLMKRLQQPWNLRKMDSFSKSDFLDRSGVEGLLVA